MASDEFSVRGSLVLLAAGILGYTLQISNGTLHPDAFNLVCVVIVLTLGAVLVRDQPLSSRTSWIPLAGGAVAVIVYFAIRFTTSPGVYLRGGGELFMEHHRYAAAAAVLSGIAITTTKSRVPIVLLLGVYFALGVWLLKASPTPTIDVWYWHRAAYEALAAGHNPYAITMPNIYGTTQWYAPGMSDATTVFVGYPYPPMMLLLGWPAHLLKQDYRYFNLVAQVLAAGLIAFSRPGRMATLAAIIYLFQPRGLFVLEQGWTDAGCATGIAAIVFCAGRWPKALPWVFGIAIAMKQYFVFGLPLLPLLLGTWKPKDLLPFLVKASIIPLIVTVPFILWSPSAFYHSTFAFIAAAPFRTDGLTVNAWLVSHGRDMLPGPTGFLLAGVAGGLALWKSDRSTSAFSAALALMFLCFFFFAKHAFTNYYYLITACLCAAAAGGFGTRAGTASRT